MSSRFPPSSGFNSRDRSPLRFGDRRPPAGPRGPDDGSPPFGREPPRGPRALVDSPRGGHFGGRGRGGYGRGEYRDRDLRDRDRDFRDNRDGPPFRRDMDRDWGRRDRDFDPRDNRIGFGRGRSRSPTRDFRDTRELPGRDFDLVRMRRNSRDSILSASSGGPDGPPPNVGHPRGGMRGRGRGDWDGGRGRGRPNFFDDREAFRRRSRSRDAWRDRGRDRMADRERGRDIDRDRPPMDRARVLDRDRDRDIMREREREREAERRERFDRRDEWDNNNNNRRPDHDDRDHPAEPWKRDRPPSRTESRAGSIAHAPPPGMGPSPSDRLADSTLDLPTRKPSIIPSAVGGSESRRDSDRSEPLPPPRPEPLKDLEPINQHSPPPSAPQVPAFGSVSALIPVAPPTKPVSEGRTSSDASAHTEKSRSDGPPKQFPQAPTGPKAERNETLPSKAPEARRLPNEESSRPSLSWTQRFDPSPMTAPATLRLHSFDGTSDLPESNTKPSPVSTSTTTSRLPPPNRSLSRDRSISPRMQASTIPTGPRALQSEPNSSPRGSQKGNKPRGRIGFNRAHSTSITPPKKDTTDRQPALPSSEKSRQDPPSIPTGVASEPPKEKEDKEPNSPVELVREVRERPSNPTPVEPPVREDSPQRAPAAEKKSEEPEQAKDQQPEIEDEPAIIPDLAPASDEEDEEMEGFSDEYLEERKRIFERDMELLRSEIPPSPLEDPHIADLLMRIQLLGKLANEDLTAATRTEPLPSVEHEDEMVPDVSTTEQVAAFDPMDVDEPNEEVSQPVTASEPAHPEVTIGALPFLSAAPPTPPSELEGWHENETSKDRMKEAFRSAITQRRKEVAKKNATLREEYMSFYKPWRLAIWELDRSKGVRPMTPLPVSASPPAIPAATSPVPPDSRASREARRHKGNSELDLQNAIQASRLSAQEEEERRRLTMVTARPDLDREAVIPDMLEPDEEKACVYKDFNNSVDPGDAMQVFGFRPPRDGFSPAEHKAFVAAFSKTPKKWGTIAEALPGRNFQDCIIHYYFTKWEHKGPKRWSKARKGKRKTKAPKKSSALMADLSVVNQDAEDGDETPAVTDTGRPRRAAAPTFGGDVANDAETPTTARRGQATRDTESIERPAHRRRAAASTPRSRGGRAKTTQSDQRSQTQPPTPLPPTQSEGNTPLSALPPMDPMDLGLDGNMDSPLPTEREPLERESMPPVAAPRARTGRGRAKEGVYVFESTESDAAMPPKPLETGYGSLQPTSYWSVPEQRDFPRLLAHYGRDFEGISNFMKTKTTVMVRIFHFVYPPNSELMLISVLQVKNYYQRRLDSGNKDFEDLLMVAEDKKARGEPTGPLPVPSIAPKRRYEATPSAIIPRPLAPHGDMMTEADEARLKGKPLAMSPQPMPIHARPLTESERGSNRYPPLAQASTAASMPSGAVALGDDSRGMRPQNGQSHRLSGPRMGFFTEDRRESSSILPHSNTRVQDMQMPSRHTPGAPMAPELARMDPLSSQPYMSAQGPPSLSSSAHSRRPSLSQLPGSPTQMSRPELDLASVHRDPFGQRQYYQLPGQPAGLTQSHHTVISPVKEVPRPSATPGPDAKVPAKRSNIMSILNDEPEEPQPRKRFASPQPPAGPVVTGASSSRSAYQLGGSTRVDDAISGATTKPPAYGQPSQYSTPSRGYPEYSSYGPPPGSAGPSANNDWMARFDPRAQQAGAQTQQPPPSQPSSRSSAGMAAQNPYSHYASAAPQSAGSLNNVAAPSPVPTPSPASQRPSYSSAFSQQPTGPAPSGSRDPREMATQPPTYRPASPPSRASSVYVSRQEPPTPAQSSASLYGLSRQPGAQSSYSPVSSNSVIQPLSQSYQQHVQTLVNGSHRSTPVSLTGGPSPYGHSTPPPQAQNGRSMPPLATLGRSFTPPSAMHASVGGNGMGYAPPPAGAMQPLHQRPTGPGSMGESSSTPTHHRVYSQGSLQGGMPGSLHPSSQQPHR